MQPLFFLQPALRVEAVCPEAGLGITESVRLEETSKIIAQMLMKMGIL